MPQTQNSTRGRSDLLGYRADTQQIAVCTNLDHWVWPYIESLMQECSNPIANALKLLQSCINWLASSDAYMRQ